MAGRYSRRGFLRVASGLAGVAMLGACGPLRGGEGGSGGAPDVPVPRLELRRRDSPDEAGRGGTLRLGTTHGGPGFDPLTRRLVYSRLVAVDFRSALVYGDLAGRIELPDPLTVHLHLRSARFHEAGNGSAPRLDAEAVQRDFERRAAEERPALFTDVIDRVDMLDRDLLVLRLRGPFGLLFESLASAVGAVRGEATYAGLTEPVGSGPFLPAGVEDGTLTLARNERYHHDGLPWLDAVTMRFFPDGPSRAAGFIAGGIDVWTGSSDSRGAEPEREGAVQMVRPERKMRALGLSLLPTRPGTQVRHVPAFQDRRVRRAIALSLDYPALLAIDQSVLAGPIGPAHRADALPPEELKQHPLYQQDPAEARSLLEAAGHVGLVFQLKYADTAVTRTLAQRIGEQMQAVGFAPALAAVTAPEMQAAFEAGDFDAAVLEIGGLDLPDVGLRLHTSGGVTGKYSPWGYSNPVYDAAVREALSAVNPAERAVRARNAQRVLLDDVPAMFPIGVPVGTALLMPDVQGYEFDAYEFNDAWLAPTWHLAGASAGEEPTAGPTSAPTREPTREPTVEPTSEPTGEPTAEPTAGPASG